MSHCVDCGKSILGSDEFEFFGQPRCWICYSALAFFIRPLLPKESTTGLEKLRGWFRIPNLCRGDDNETG